MTGSVPHAGCDDNVALSNIRAGKAPQRPSDGVTDLVWEFLEKCWNMDPSRRPSAARVYDAFARLSSLPPEIQRLPGKLVLEVQSIKISLNELRQQWLCVKFQYGNKGYTTSLTTNAVIDGEYMWFAFRPFPPSLPSLNLGQERSGNLGDRNQRISTPTDGRPRSAPPCTYIQERQGVRDREFLRKSGITPRLQTWLIIHV